MSNTSFLHFACCQHRTLRSHLQDPPPRLDGTLDDHQNRACDTLSSLSANSHMHITPGTLSTLGCDASRSRRKIWPTHSRYTSALASSQMGNPLFVHVCSSLPSFNLRSHFVISFKQFHGGHTCTCTSPRWVFLGFVRRITSTTSDGEGPVHPEPVLLQVERPGSIRHVCFSSSNPVPLVLTKIHPPCALLLLLG